MTVAAAMKGRLDRLMSQAYFRRAYRPVVVPAPVRSLPAEQHLSTVPWIVEDKPVCQSVALQMIAAHVGVERSRAEIDFLMGFTYGAGYRSDWGFMTVGVDPETGMATAAGYLGLVLHYRTSNDAGRYLAALRGELAEGRPVRVPLDMGTLYGQAEPLPHNEVVVGYDPSGLWYYEPISMAPSPCPPGRHQPGEHGLHVCEERLLAAVQRQAELFGYPWRYALVCFEPTSPRSDLAPLWRKNGAALVGGSRWGQRWGAAATEYVATLIGNGVAPPHLAERGTLFAMVTRPDNAAYLRAAHPDDEDLADAADDFDRAADAYQAAHDIIGTESDTARAHKEIARQLMTAADAERAAGQRFLRWSRSATARPRRTLQAG